MVVVAETIDEVVDEVVDEAVAENVDDAAAETFDETVVLAGARPLVDLAFNFLFSATRRAFSSCIR